MEYDLDIEEDRIEFIKGKYRQLMASKEPIEQKCLKDMFRRTGKETDTDLKRWCAAFRRCVERELGNDDGPFGDLEIHERMALIVFTGVKAPKNVIESVKEFVDFDGKDHPKEMNCKGIRFNCLYDPFLFSKNKKQKTEKNEETGDASQTTTNSTMAPSQTIIRAWRVKAGQTFKMGRMDLISGLDKLAENIHFHPKFKEDLIPFFKANEKGTIHENEATAFLDAFSIAVAQVIKHSTNKTTPVSQLNFIFFIQKFFSTFEAEMMNLIGEDGKFVNVEGLEDMAYYVMNQI